MGKGGGGGTVSRDSLQSAAKYFWQSQPARRAVFSQLTSALKTGGGPGFKSGVVQQGIARSQAAGQAAMANAGTQLAGSPDMLRSRIINRISQSTKESASRMGPSFANALIGQAPTVIGAGGAAQSDLSRVAASGEIAGLEAAATKAAGWGNAAASLAGAGGRVAGMYANRPTTPTVATPAPAATPATSPGWYQRYFGGGA